MVRGVRHSHLTVHNANNLLNGHRKVACDPVILLISEAVSRVSLEQVLETSKIHHQALYQSFWPHFAP